MSKKKKPVEIIENIVELPLEEVMGERFGIYAKEVIQNRAIPDVRDGLKPVQRRIIYAMFEEGNVATKPMKKCAHTVGSVMGKYHPHGDSSIYEALARLSQEWNVRYPLIDFQGNKGSIDGDSPAAYRYTESRLSELSELLVLDLNKNTVDQALTFDDSAFEPTVLPARFPNLLVNGSQGIAVAVATEIPPHNLSEVIDALIFALRRKRYNVSDLREFIKGPDFPTGGKIYESDGLDAIYETGRGRIEIAATAHFERSKAANLLVITEIPYQVNKSNLLRDIGLIEQRGQVDGIVEVRDESDREGLRIVIELKKEANEEVIKEYLFDKTALRTSYNANIVAISENRPKTLNLVELIDSYIHHQIEVITRRSEFDLARYLKRLHIVDGLIKAISVVDEVVKIIRGSTDKSNAKQNLIAKYNFSEEQAEAIVMLQLYKLTNTDISILTAEKEKLNGDIDKLKNILEDEKALRQVIVNDLREIKRKFGDERRTKITDEREVVQIDKRDLIADEDVMVALTRDGYIKRSSLKSYRSSGDNVLPGVKSSDLLVATGLANTKDFMIAFTHLGNYLYIPVYEILEGRWKDEGKHLNNLIALNPEEKIVRAFIVREFRDDLYFTTVTEKGMIKRSVLTEFVPQRYTRPLICMRILKGDALVDAALTTGDSDLLIVTRSGSASFYNENEITVVSLKASGVKALNMAKKDTIVSLHSVDPDSKMRTGIITSEGHLRLVDYSYFMTTARLGRQQHVMRVFKSDPHHVVSTFQYPKNSDAFTINVLTSENIILPLLISDLSPTPVDKYAKKNINELGNGAEITGILEENVQVISKKTKAYQPVVQAESVVVEQAEEKYEQMSIFDILDD
ncbi:MAG TPA: DNA topoisomerase IV subunit A [Bacilli bacterium]|nr:DNA topoisomerase IV subunit A [Bacilli bacterium]